jgi:2-oxoglutarate/2-oxoacid ferredoxin oxidoreductase subunit beta
MFKKDANDLKKDLGTKEVNTWCPGCPNFLILESVKTALAGLISKGVYKQEDFAMTTDIGCSSKIYDYLNISGIYGLHGRSLATGLGITLGNPNLKVLSFIGDGGCFDEGIAHFMHAGRYNSDMTLIVHDNQSFSLTTGQPTATSQQGYVSKASPLGDADYPLNPLKVALAANIGFIARCSAKDFKHTAEILEKAIQHKGFSYVEIIQDCLIFNKEMNNKDDRMYKVEDNTDKKKAEKIADEYDYNNGKGKIALGVLYSEDKPALYEKWAGLKKLKDSGVGWKG